MAVFNYYITSGHSSYSINYADEQRIITAYKGLVYGDSNTGEITRIRFEAVDIPSSFPIKETNETLDYDLQEISGQQYVVPLAVKLFMTSGRDRTKNEMEFRSYRKFGTESNIIYDMNPTAPPPEPLPASKTEEQPASASDSSPAKQAARDKQKPTTTSSPWILPAPPPPPPPE